MERSSSADSAAVAGGCGTGEGVVQHLHLDPSLCPQPGSGAAAPQAEEGHEEGGQTRSRAAVCGAGEELSLGCVYWRVAGCVGAGPRGSAAGGGIAGVMPEVGREGQGCPGTGGWAGG